MISSALIGGKFIFKNPLHDLLSSLNFVISTNQTAQFITVNKSCEPCSFGSGLRKFALDFVVLVFFSKMQKKLQVVV